MKSFSLDIEIVSLFYSISRATIFSRIITISPVYFVLESKLGTRPDFGLGLFSPAEWLLELENLK